MYIKILKKLIQKKKKSGLGSATSCRVSFVFLMALGWTVFTYCYFYFGVHDTFGSYARTDECEVEGETVYIIILNKRLCSFFS